MRTCIKVNAMIGVKSSLWSSKAGSGIYAKRFIGQVNFEPEWNRDGMIYDGIGDRKYSDGICAAVDESEEQRSGWRWRNEPSRRFQWQGDAYRKELSVTANEWRGRRGWLTEGDRLTGWVMTESEIMTSSSQQSHDSWLTSANNSHTTCATQSTYKR